MSDESGNPEGERQRAREDERGATGGERLEVTVDRGVCMGSGNCQFWAPNVFDLDDEGVAVVVDAAGDPEDKIVLAARGCPTQAITVTRGDEQIAP